jgi:hypothetical protein
VATNMPPLRQLPDLTPAPAILRALADVGEVDLVQGLGKRRLAELVRSTASTDSHRHSPWPRLVWLLAAMSLLFLALS